MSSTMTVTDAGPPPPQAPQAPQASEAIKPPAPPQKAIQGAEYEPKPDLAAKARAVDERIRALAEAQRNPPPAPAGDRGTEGGATPYPGAAAQAGGPEVGTSESPPVAPQSDELARLEQEARTWKGRLDAEREQKRLAVERQNQLEEELQQLREQATRTRVEEVSKPLVVTDEMRESFGEDLMEAVAAQAHATVKPMIDAVLSMVDARLSALQTTTKKVMQHQSQTTFQQFVAELSARIPNFVELDNSREFGEWLTGQDPTSLGTRKMVLDSLAKSQDVPATVAFYQAFLNQQAGRSPGTANGAGQQAPTPSPHSLEDFAAPGNAAGRVTAPSAPASGQGDNWTVSQIQAFYRDVATGKFRSREDERQRIEKSLFAAQAAGKVDHTR